MRILLTIFLLFPLIAKPDSDGYFQQHVCYSIDAELNTRDKTIRAAQSLIYTNNSPDTLDRIYFHLYMNRFREGAQTETGRPRQSTSAWIEIDSLKLGDAAIDDYEINSTLMRLPLAQPLLPGDSLQLSFNYRVKLPYADSRFGHAGDHFDVGNWYVTPVVYDRDGWHLNQHVENEFYQEWGNFRVNITVPKGFILGATGKLLNEAEAMQDTARSVRRMHLYEGMDSVPTTTWQYEARNVHDFAWTADPGYKIIDYKVDSTRVRFLVMPENYQSWLDNSAFIEECLRFFNREFSPYPYNNLTIADTYITAGGIEYPQIVFINTFAGPRYELSYWRAVVIHEVAHQWFYGLLASNQSEDEWLDEGFTAWAEVIAMEHIFGTHNNYAPSDFNWLVRTFGFERDDRQDMTLNYLEWTKSGGEQDPIDTNPDYFRDGVYISQYDKMALVLEMLRDVLGDDKFSAAMRAYCREWQFRHPSTRAMKRSFSRVTGQDLDWFWEQWLHSTRQLDLAVDGFSHFYKNDSLFARINLSSQADAFMPFDLLLRDSSGNSLLYRVSQDVFARPRRDRIYLEPWPFNSRQYSVDIPLTRRLASVEIDPGEKLLDVNRLNNLKGAIRTYLYAMKPQSYAPPTDGYMWELWPIVFYNDIDKLKAGTGLYGNYVNSDHLIHLKLWLNSYTQKADFYADYRHPLRFLSPALRQTISGYKLEGHAGASLSWSFTKDDASYYNLFLRHHYHSDPRYPASAWETGTFNKIGLEYSRVSSLLNNRQSIRFDAILENSLAGSKKRFSKLQLKYRHTFYSEFWDYSLSLSAHLGISSTTTPLQERFNLAGANGMDEFDHPLYRSKGTLPVHFEREGNFYIPDGAGVRGASFGRNALNVNMAAISLDWQFPSPLAVLPWRLFNKFDTGLFADAGTAYSTEIPGISAWQRSMGVSVSYNQFSVLREISGLDLIRMDFPLWLEQPANSTEKRWQWRWLLYIGIDIGRSPFF